METSLKLYTFVDGINDTPFPNSENQIEIGAFKYDAKRMGGAPEISATIEYPTCLDEIWTLNVYAEFNGEKYYLKQTPTSSYSNAKEAYIHEVELVSERVRLDGVYFFDAVDEDVTIDRPVSNSTKFTFFGNIRDFALRLNQSLSRSGILVEYEDGTFDGYKIFVDDNIESEEKLVSFEDKFVSEAIQESFKTYDIPYYFKGRECHFGYSEDVFPQVLKYGVDNELLSIKKENANYKVVNRATGTGSTDNIPFYYPNNSPKGDIAAESSDGIDVKIMDYETYADKVAIDGEIVFAQCDARIDAVYLHQSMDLLENGKASIPNTFQYDFWIDYVFDIIAETAGLATLKLRDVSDIHRYNGEDNKVIYKTAAKLFINREQVSSGEIHKDSFSLFEIPVQSEWTKVIVSVLYQVNYFNTYNRYRGTFGLAWDISNNNSWEYKSERISLKDYGIELTQGNPQAGDKITQKLIKYINPQKNLMPSIYRETDGAERFYNAENNKYKDEDGNDIIFPNPYVAGRPQEQIVKFDSIKPTIKEMTNSLGQRIDMFSAIGFDLNDNDETYIDEDGKTMFKHPHFFVKLRKLPFNLFDQAIEGNDMTISITSGVCGACDFKIKVDEEFPYANPVQVDANGNLKYDENGMVLCGVEGSGHAVTAQPQQQDTINNEVWIALEKQEETYGILMPKAPVYDGETLVEAGYRPKACTGANSDDGDTFVILHINLPKEYITAAEKKLTDEIIKYMLDNNLEKFNFSITFSKIYFAENPDVLALLNENTRLNIEYNGTIYTLYVSSFSYNMSSGSPLPDITVDLVETLEVSQNALQNAISQVAEEVSAAVSNIDILAKGMPYFLRKDVDDIANGVINFRRGVKFSDGGKVEVDENNNTKLTIDYLDVKKKAVFTSLEIQEKTHVGGQLLITPASILCNSVEEVNGAYRCHFQNFSELGDEIFNEFVVGDQAICQTFNAFQSKYYWRLVVGTGENYIDLSIDDCDANSDIPAVGDKIIQLGNRTDIDRQNAITLSAYGDGAPSIVLYSGVSSFSLAGKNITGIIYNPETKEPQMYSFGSVFFGDRALTKNFITFQKKLGSFENEMFINANVQLGAGSSGLTNLAEWSEKQGQIDNAQDTADEAKSTAENALEKANEAKNYIDNTLPTEIAAINDKLDGVVENWFEPYTPTKINNPAAAWIRDGEEAEHEGDTFTNTQSFVDNSTTPDAGKSWRWVKKSDGTYDWTPIADSDAVKALLQAAKAQDTADQKRRIFVTTPYTPYEVGDMWTQGGNGDIMRCIVSRLTGSYQASDWDKASKYTDDTTAQEAKDAVSDLEYIKTLFPSQNIITNGAVLSSLLGVKDDNDNIVAGMNGTDLGKDTNHGKALVFAGSTNLNNIPGAKTKIYEDGTVETNELIAKSGCKIGAFEINNYQQIIYSNYQDLNKDEERDMLLTPGGIEFERIALDGRTIKSLHIRVSDSELMDVSDNTPTLSIYQNDSLLQQSMAALSVQKAADGPAISVSRGQFMGLRPATRTVNANVTLNTTDHTILIDSTVARRITLPANPDVGQEYLILMVGVPSTTVKHTLASNANVPIHWPAGDAWSLTSTTLTANGAVYLKCANDKNGAKKWWLYRFL